MSMASLAEPFTPIHADGLLRMTVTATRTDFAVSGSHCLQARDEKGMSRSTIPRFNDH